MLGKFARLVSVLLLLLSLTGCQSWFYVPKADVLPQWEEFRKEGAQVELYLEPEPVVGGSPAPARNVPPRHVDLAVLLPATPPFVHGRAEPQASDVTDVDARRVSHALVRRFDSSKAAHIGLGVVGGVASLAGLTFLIAIAVSLRGLDADHGL